jgi:DNA primase
MKHEKLSFIEAIEKIADIIGVQVEHEEAVIDKKNMKQKKHCASRWTKL